MNLLRRASVLTHLLSIMLSSAVIAATEIPGDEQALWQSLRAGESVAIMRHALAPGNGDPSSFNIDDCSTQRNLSSEGLSQAAGVGELMRINGVVDAEIYSSQWCRCLDTATALEYDEPVALPILNSFYQDRSTELQQTVALQNWVKNRLEKPENGPKIPAVLVTHQVNITALSGVFPASGEIVFVTYESELLEVLGTIETR